MTTSSTPRASASGGRKALVVVAGVVVGAGLGFGAHVLMPAQAEGEEVGSIADGPHPTPSVSNAENRIDLDWRDPRLDFPEVKGWDPEAEPGWPGVALGAGDLWALESVSVSGGEETAVYLVGPEGRRLELMGLPWFMQLVGWDHDAGLAYGQIFNENLGPVVIDLATHEWAYIPIPSEWEETESAYGSVWSMGTTASGEVIWSGQGDAPGVGTWDPVDGWDIVPLSTDLWLIPPGVPSDWIASPNYTDDRVTILNVVTHESIVLPGTNDDWNTGWMEYSLTWVDGDTIARPPSGGEDWMGYSAPTFDVGTPLELGDMPLGYETQRSSVQYPGTPLVATLSDRAGGWRQDIARLGVLTTDGYREIVDFATMDAAPVQVNTVPVEGRAGVYVFTSYEGTIFTVDATTGETYSYGIGADFTQCPPLGSCLTLNHVVYVAPEEGDADATPTG